MRLTIGRILLHDASQLARSLNSCREQAGPPFAFRRYDTLATSRSRVEMKRRCNLESKHISRPSAVRRRRCASHTLPQTRGEKLADRGRALWLNIKYGSGRKSEIDFYQTCLDGSTIAGTIGEVIFKIRPGRMTLAVVLTCHLPLSKQP